MCHDSYAQGVRETGPEGYLFLGLSSVCGLLPPPSGLGLTQFPGDLSGSTAIK